MKYHWLALLLVTALCCPGLAEDPPEPTYADKPASWWIGQMLESDRNKAAADVVREMGAGAAPALTSVLSETRPTRDRTTLLALLARTKGAAVHALPEVRKSLRARYPSEVEAALRVVTAIGPKAAPVVKEVAALLPHEQARIRRASLTALRRLGVASAAFVDQIADRLGDEDKRTLWSALAAIASLGPDAHGALPRLERYVETHGVTPAVLRALALAAADSEATLQAFHTAIESEDEYLHQMVNKLIAVDMPPGPGLLSLAEEYALPGSAYRTASARALGRCLRDSGEVSETLFVLLASDVQQEVGASIEALSRQPDTVRPYAERIGVAFRESAFPMAFSRLLRELAPDTTPALIRAATYDDEAVRNAAWHTLERLPPDSLALSSTDLRMVMFEERVAVKQRWRLLYTLSNTAALTDPDVRPVLVSIALELPHEMAFIAAAVLVHDRGDITAILPLVRGKDAELAASIIGMLAAARHSETLVQVALLDALVDGRRAVRASALQGLVTLHRNVGQTALPAALTDEQRAAVWDAAEENRSLSAYALTLILSAGDPVPEIPPRHLPWLLSEPSAAIAVSRMPIAPSALEQLLSVDDDLVALLAAELWLKRKGSPDNALPRIKAGFDSSDDAVRRAAVLAALALDDEQLVQIGAGIVRVLDARGPVSGQPACHALLRLAARTPRAKEALLAVADDPKHPAHAGMAGFIAGFGEDGQRRLVTLLKSPVRDARRNAVIVILQMETNTHGSIGFAREALLNMADCEDLELADLARKALDQLDAG